LGIFKKFSLLINPCKGRKFFLQNLFKREKLARGIFPPKLKKLRGEEE